MMYLGKDAVGIGYEIKKSVGDWTDATKWISTFTVDASAAPLPDTIILDASNISSTSKVFNLPTAWTVDYGYRHIIIKNSNIKPFMLQGLYQNYYPTGRDEAVTCIFEDGMQVANVALSLQYIGYNSNVPWPKIYGEIDLSLLDGTKQYFLNTMTVAHIEFKPNSCSLLSQFSFASYNSTDKANQLDDESCISIANALKDGIAGAITLPSALQTRFSSIMGQNDNTTYNYNFFVKDTNGTLTLLDFITNKKGWTIS